MTKLNNIAIESAKPQNRYYRSVRIDSDINSIDTLKGYILTNHVLHLLGRIEEGLSSEAGERAWTLTGPYGSGKSAFALFLANLLSETNYDESNYAYELLKQKDSIFANHLANKLDGRGLYPIAITLRRAPLARSVLEGFLNALQKQHNRKPIQKLISEIKHDLSNDQLDSQVVINRITSFMDAFNQQYRGVLLVLDELGKSLEYTARHTGQDVHLLQELAEFATRSEEKCLLLVGILHQSFELYGEFLDHTARQEWAKVQGRFCDVAFIEPSEQQVRLAKNAIASLGFSKMTDGEKNKATESALKMFDYGFIPNGFKRDDVESIADSAYPLHITVLNALPYLFSRFAQNQRSLFAYLLSNEPFGLQELSAGANSRLIRLPDLYDYFSSNISGNITKQIHNRRWYVISDALERAPDLTIDEVKILKTIGLLDLLGETHFMLSKPEFISLALFDEPNNDIVQECLSNLQNKSLIVYRRFNKTYKIWEGSDVDIEARLDEGYRKTKGLNLSEDLQQFLPNRPMVARKHSHEVGAMRYFEIRYIDSPVQASHLIPNDGLDGIVVCCLPGSQTHVKSFEDWIISEEIAFLKNVIVVVPQEIGPIRDTASELRAIHWVWQNTPELRDDRIARRELSERTALFEQLLSQAVQKLLDPRSEPFGTEATWFYLGSKQKKVKNLRDISELLSTVMDNIYCGSPYIKNELVNRRVISSAASAARRNLIEGMLVNTKQAVLGIEGYPPERSIYESILKVSGLHNEIQPYWQLPKEDHDPLNLRPAFKHMEEIVFGSIEEPYSVNSLLVELMMPPYGIMPGVFPILLVSYLLIYPDEISLYRDGVFIPEPNIADFEVLMRRPELYSVAGSYLHGERLLMVQRISKSLNVRPTTLSVTKAIINMVRQLPDHAWRTRQLPKPVIKLRTAIEQARSPERLLFLDIPRALDELPFTGDMDDCNNRIDQFFNKLNMALQTWSRVTEDRITQAGNILLSTCNMPSGMKGWQELINIAQKLDEKPLNETIRPFIKRLTLQNDLDTVVESVLALIANRPPRSWTDREVEDFPMLAKQIGDNFIAFTHMHEILSPIDEIACKKLIKQLRLQLKDETSPQIVKVALSRVLQDL